MKKSFQFIPVSLDFIILRNGNYDFLLKKDKEYNLYHASCGCWKCLQNISLALRASTYESDRIIVVRGDEDRNENFVKLLRMFPEKPADNFLEEVFESSNINGILNCLTYLRSMEDLLSLIDDKSRNKALRHLPLAE